MLFLALLFVVTTSSHIALAACPRIVSRSEWGARAPVNTNPQKVPVPFVVLHHGGISTFCNTEAECGEQARSYQRLHVDENKWDDVGYSFMVGEDGNVYEGRGWWRVGAHAPQYNNQSIGICIIGDFSDRLPNPAALEAVHELIACGVEQNLIYSNYTILGHRQVRHTLCPGEALYAALTAWPHWTEDPSPRKYQHPHEPPAGDSASTIDFALATALFLRLALFLAY